MRFTILTLGCKTNQAESQYIASELINLGYEEVDLALKPDLCIINTCTVTAKTDYQSRQLIRRALKTGARVVVTGCYVNSSLEEIKNLGNNIRIFRNNEKFNIINELNYQNSSITSNLIQCLSTRARPLVKVQEGCDNHCTYCIIPHVRGKARSRELPEIIKEIKTLEASGYKEIVLTGTNLGSWGIDLKPQVRLEDLIEEILSATSNIRIRISSLGIKELSGRLINLIEKSNRICKHLHLSLQSGSRNILSLMNRHYQPEDFISFVETLKKKIPHINIGVDVIVGFPGEGEREFQETLQCLKEAQPGYIHVFPYSRRPGTPAANMPEQVDERTKQLRVNIIRELDDVLRQNFLSSQIGKSTYIIIEDIGNGLIRGKTDNYLNAIVPIKSRSGFAKGEYLYISVQEVTERALIGEAILND